MYSFTMILILIPFIDLYNAESKQNSPLQPTIDTFMLKFIKQQMETEQNENIFFSPFGVQVILTLIMGGARGHTEDSMRQTLGYIHDDPRLKDREAIKEEYDKIISQYLSNNSSLMNSNLVAISKEAKLKPEFKKYGEGFHAQISTENFANPSEAQRKINSLVANTTKNMLPKLLQTPPSMMTMMLALNAIYFKVDWNETFDANLTESKDFVNADGKLKKVPLMSRRRGSRSRYQKSETFAIVEIPYKGSISMYILMPHRNETLHEVIAEIKYSWKLERILNSLITRRFDYLSIPKFKIKKEYKLNGILMKMGMNVAFSDGADFSGISDRNIKISGALHKALIEVNEEGIQAAAPYPNLVMKSRPHLLLNFVIDRPFMFLIRDRSNQITLFAGVINKL